MRALFADVVLLVVAMTLGGVEGNVGRAAGALVALVVFRDGRWDFGHGVLRQQRNRTTDAAAETFHRRYDGALSPAAKKRFSPAAMAATEIPVKAIGAIILLALAGPAFAQAGSKASKDKASAADRPLLATFCDSASIKGSACTNAKGYRSGRRCDVKLQPDRHGGKFLADGTTLLVVNYESGCEPHATNFGGAVVFEQKDGAISFRGYQPGFQANDCIVLARNEKQDRLICITFYLGQGHLESGVAEMVFTQDFRRNVAVAELCLRADNSTGAYGANVVDCKETSVYSASPSSAPGRGLIPSRSTSPMPTRTRSRPPAPRASRARRKFSANYGPARPMSRPATRRRRGS